MSARVASLLSGDRLASGVFAGRDGGHSTFAGGSGHGDGHPGLPAAGLGVGHLLLGDGGVFLAHRRCLEFLLEIEVRARRRISNVLSHVCS